jgi:hypothetical protein
MGPVTDSPWFLKHPGFEFLHRVPSPHHALRDPPAFEASEFGFFSWLLYAPTGFSLFNGVFS